MSENPPQEPPPISEGDIEAFLAQLEQGDSPGIFDGEAAESAVEGARAGRGQSQDDPAEGLDAQQSQEEGSPQQPRTARTLVLTSVADPQALASACALVGLDVWVVPSDTGCIVTPREHERVLSPEQCQEWDLAQMQGNLVLGDVEAEIARALSEIITQGVVVVSVSLSGKENGMVNAQRWEAGKAGEFVSPGLLFSILDSVMEDLMLRELSPSEIKGALLSSEFENKTRRPGRLFRNLWKDRDA